ncbi:MAG: WbqC family protein [Gammaproteobacteria bacterium]|nr:WbqC family protein [Gammaproteobacteria bacterium]
MQPYFLPYSGYWQLMAYCDHWVIFDVVKYNKRSWMNRNRVLHPDSSKPFQYIHLPVKSHKNGEEIKDVVINNDESWCSSLKGKLSFYKRMRAPYYEDTIALIDSIALINDDCFPRFLAKHFEIVMRAIGLEFSYSFASDMSFSTSEIGRPDDWALQITKHLKANIYINPHGGRDLFNEQKYHDNGISLKFLKPRLSHYPQGKRVNFSSGMSIIDYLMFNSLEATRDMLTHDFDVIHKG